MRRWQGRARAWPGLFVCAGLGLAALAASAAPRWRWPLGGVGVFSGLGGALARSGAQNLRAGGAL